MNHFILNTNRKLDPSGRDEKRMLNEQLATAFRDRRGEISKLNRGDIVFLYRVKEGIIAYGVVTGNLQVQEYRGEVAAAHFKRLKSFHVLADPISPQTIRRLAGGKIAFHKTLIRISASLARSLLDKFDEEVFVAKAA